MSAQRTWLERISGARGRDLPCRVEVSHRFESLGAHVDLGPNVVVRPGDRVRVHGAPIHVPYGEVIVEERTATLVRAPWWERLWLEATGDLEFRELIDVSFTDRRHP
jgi:hypothetical protein